MYTLNEKKVRYAVVFACGCMGKGYRLFSHFIQVMEITGINNNHILTQHQVISTL